MSDSGKCCPESVKAPHGIRLRVFDFVLDVQCDSGQCIDTIARLLGRFVVENLPDDRIAQKKLVVLTQPDSPWNSPIAILDGGIRPLDLGSRPNSPSLEEFVYRIVCLLISANTQTHFLFHAAALSYSGEGIVLAGDPGYGKTTLTLALLRRGCRFLSDEFAALNRSDNQLHPFPRSLQIEPDTLERTGFRGVVHSTTFGLEKLILDIDQLGFGWLGTPVPLRHVIILRRSGMDGDRQSPDFALEPQLLPCRVDQAALQMLKHHYGGLGYLLEGEYNHDFLLLYMDMVRVLRKVACYELRVGQLEQEVDLLWDVFGNQ